MNALTNTFWAQVDKTDDCWLWLGATTATGYGRMHGNRKAHRVAYEATCGPVSPDLELDHLCNVRNCVNPNHLEAVTHQENVRRAVARRVTCGKGHPRTEANQEPRTDRPGKYRCRPCRQRSIGRAS